MGRHAKKMKWPKGLFMRLIIIFCIAYIVRVVELGLNICQFQNTSPAPIVTAAITFFGAELAMCVIKRVMEGKDKKEKKDNEKTPKLPL